SSECICSWTIFRGETWRLYGKSNRRNVFPYLWLWPYWLPSQMPSPICTRKSHLSCIEMSNPPISLCQKQEVRPCWSILARPKNLYPVQSQMSCPAVHLVTPLLNYTGREPIPELISTAWDRPSMCC